MSVALNVVIVLGIVIAGGFLLFFLGDFLMALFEVKKDKVEETKIYVQPATGSKEEVLTEGVVQAYNPEEEKEEENVEEKTAAEEEAEAEDKLDEEEEQRIAEARAALEKRKQEILRRMQAQLEEEEEEEEDEEEIEEEEELVEEVEETVEDEVEETEEATAEEENNEEETEVEAEEDVLEEEKTEETTETVEDEEVEDAGVLSIEEELVEENEVVAAVDTDALQAEIEKLRNELGLQKEKNEMLEKELAEKEEADEEVSVIGSKEDYERMLAEKQAKLKVIEKEFKQCKKDFIPLFRVQKNLEKDEKKLHRREAIVAKQKVVLYGVNNYADIDEEKAKKLAEDLDLLDGLKLSVNHCKEVMELNKERYPILEKLYNTLKSQVEGLKLEIENIESTIATFGSEEETVEE